MPMRKQRLTKVEDREYRNRLSHLGELGIPIGDCGAAPPDPDPLTLEQTPEPGSIYELPLAEVVVVVPVKLTVVRSGTLVTDAMMVTPWEETQLDLVDPEEISDYQNAIGRRICDPHTVLNRWLEHKVALRSRQLEGVIVGHGHVTVPAECREDTAVNVKLLLTDRGRDQLSFEFVVRLDRSAIRNCERRRRERLALAQSTERNCLFESDGGQPQDEKSGSRERAIKRPRASGLFS
ncbi:MAG: hypothetical protein WBW85_14890 [Terriglobales bacterium]